LILGELVERCRLNVRTLPRIESIENNPQGYTTKIIFEALDFDIYDESSNKELLTKTHFEYKIKKNLRTNIKFRLNEKLKKIHL